MDTKPGASLQERAVFPIFWAAATTAALVASLVPFPLMISTSFMMGTGFMKCIPMTLSGRPVDAAMVEIEMDEVFEARIVSGLQMPSSSENISCFNDNISGTASTTRSQSAHKDRSVPVVMCARAASAWACVMRSLLTNLPSEKRIVSSPLSTNSCLISIITTS